MTETDVSAAVVRVRTFYSQISRERLREIEALYAPSAYFRDPFNEVRGIGAIRGILERMLDDLDDCRFAFLDSTVDACGAFVTWDFTFRMRRWRPQTVQRIHGATHLRFDASGRIAYHRDYWDAAEELYAKLPMIGPVVRYLRKRIA